MSTNSRCFQDTRPLWWLLRLCGREREQQRKSTLGMLSNTRTSRRDFSPAPGMMVNQKSPKTPKSMPETPLTPLEAITRPTSVPQLSISFDALLATKPYKPEQPASLSERAGKLANRDLISKVWKFETCQTKPDENLSSVDIKGLLCEQVYKLNRKNTQKILES